MQELKLAVRSLSKAFGFSIAAVLMLAFGIGATTAIFSIVEGVLLRPLPFPDPSRLVAVGDNLEGSTWDEPGVTAPEIGSYTRETHSFASLGAYQQIDLELSGAGDPSQVHGARMSGGMFRVLETAPLLGRAITADDDEKRQQVAVLSYGAWRGRFHANPAVVGTTISLDRTPYIVIGVMPRGFDFPLLPGQLNHTELWVPLSLTKEELTTGVTTWDFAMAGRLEPGTTAAQALADVQRVAEETMRNYPAFARHLHILPVVTPLQESIVRGARPLLRMLFLAVGVVLLLACANLAGLLLVRSIRRQKEIAVRRALGARAAALLGQAISESLVLSLSGGLMGLALAGAAIRLGVSFLPETMPRVDEIGLSWPMAAFALGLAVLTGVLCGLFPALAAMRTNANEALKEGGRAATLSGGQARLRSSLVVLEIAIALTLLAASGVLLRSFEKMREVSLGFRPDHTLVAAYSLPRQQYSTQSAVDAFNESLLGNLRRSPGAVAAGLTSLLPAGADDNDVTMTFAGYVPPKGAALNMATPSAVSGNFFPALGIRLLRGRVLTEADDARAPLAVVVNRQLAERYWPGQDPIGKRVHRGLSQSANPWMTVVGEVDDVKLGARDGRTAPQIYQPVAQWKASRPFAAATELDGSSGYIVLRTMMPPEQMENTLRATVRGIDPELALDQVQTMDHAISASEAPRWFDTVLVLSFAVAALLLSMLGIYSVIAFTAALRQQEMAIRMALGCQRSGVLGLVLASGARLSAVGCLLGALGVIAVSRILRSFLFGVSPFDPLVLASAIVAMLLLALAACALPAARAANTDPALALRGE